MLPRNENELPSIISGIFQVFGWNILIMFVGITVPFIGIVQLLYVIPLAIHLNVFSPLSPNPFHFVCKLRDLRLLS